MADAPGTLYTIGHSTHPAERLIELLRQHGITAAADVRSAPYSRMNPQFNRETLRATLKQSGIAYVFLGEELGARSDDPACYEDGKVQYDRLAQTAVFKKGIERVRGGMRRYRVALMCAEKEPLSCHRTILVARHFEAAGVRVAHILSDGSVETHEQALSRLVGLLGLPGEDMFRSRAEVVEDAYRTQGARIAYEKKDAARSP
jgi:uncharacterized protein (DUF488 family)